MLTELLLLAGAGFLGKKAIENPDKAKAAVGKLMDSAMKQADRNYSNGTMSKDDYDKMKSNYNNVQAQAGEWQIKEQMNEFTRETGYDESSVEYQEKLQSLYERRNEYNERLARQEEYIQMKKNT